MGLVLEAGDTRQCVDVAATAAGYRSLQDDACPCWLCENFRAAWDRSVGPGVWELLRRLGVDPAKPAEIVHYGKHEARGHLYTAEWVVLAGIGGGSGRSITWSPPRAGVTLDIRDQGVPTAGAFKDDPRTRWLMLTVADVPWVAAHEEPA